MKRRERKRAHSIGGKEEKTGRGREEVCNSKVTLKNIELPYNS